MRRRIGNFMMLLGAALVIAALLLFFANRREDAQAGASADALLPEVVAEIERRNAELTGAAIAPAVSPTAAAEDSEIDSVEPTLAPTRTPPRYVDPYDTEMTAVVVRGYSYVGYLSIPKLGLDLPVMSDWSYPRLRVAPCRYSGSTKTDDLVILAHNYARHFGRLRNLSPGDAIIFTDMNGVVTRYRVIELEEMSPYAVTDMVGGEYDLTLFTCTYGGRTRFAVRADVGGAD